MRYLYEVILVNPKNDDFFVSMVVANSETSAFLRAYNLSQLDINSLIKSIQFDDLKTQCRVLMSWEKEQRTTACE